MSIVTDEDKPSSAVTSAMGSAMSSISVVNICLPASASDSVAVVGGCKGGARSDGGLGDLRKRGGGGALGDQGFFWGRGTLALAALAKDAQNRPELGRTSFLPGNGAAGSGWLNLSSRHFERLNSCRWGSAGHGRLRAAFSRIGRVQRLWVSVCELGHRLFAVLARPTS